MKLLLMFSVAFTLGCGNDVRSPPLDSDPAGEPVYYGQVERIMRDNCVECHSTDPDRLAPFSLATFKDAFDAADTAPISFAVNNRTMPPYFATNDGECQDLHGTKWLTEEEIGILTAWTNGQHLEGNPADTVAPLPPPAALPEVNKTLDIGANYTPDATRDDDYRCFVVPALGANAFLTGVHVRPTNFKVAHHVILYTLDSAASQQEVEQRDLMDSGPGYNCNDGVSDVGASFLTGWAPGQGATVFPAGTGVPVDGTRKLVIQLHYNLANSDGRPDHTVIDLDLAATVTSPAQIVSVRGDVDLDWGKADAIATGTRALVLPGTLTSARVWGAMMHMHNRGTGGELIVERSANSCLLDLAGWSFHWQHFYWYSDPLRVNRDETLRVTCHYDTTGDTARVTWGEGTEQEMCLAYLYISR